MHDGPDSIRTPYLWSLVVVAVVVDVQHRK
jgi:hypothetical protein